MSKESTTPVAKTKETLKLFRKPKPTEADIAKEAKRRPSLANVKLDEGTMKCDFQLTDKYQGYSSELLRLPLLGIGVFGFLLKENFINAGSNGAIKFMLSFSAVCFALAAALALFHRYVSTDSIATHIRYLRLEKSIDPKTSIFDEKDKRYLLQERYKERVYWRRDLKLSDWSLKSSAILLGLGASCLAFALILILYPHFANTLVYR
ncbi:MAG TPA: hypothetical protein VGO69_10450 [Pyrinomonadaceae bacterium]|jgi:hypothetical protein|nr:hypothetical protein [Pyrinomonadaceae bacterium]